MEKHVYFVRHGESDSNSDGIFRGRDSMLTELGKQQAVIVAERVERLNVEALVTSPFPRTLDTAAAITRRTGLTAEPCDYFGEWLEPKVLRDRHWDEPEVREIHDKLLERHDDPHYRHSDEETVAELTARAQAGLAFLEKHPKDRICVVTHGAFLRVIIGTIIFGEEFGPKHFKYFFHHMVTKNTGITYVRNTKPEYGWQLVSWNDAAHLG